MRRSSPITGAFPEPVGATLEPIGRRVSAPAQNWPTHLANCATESVQRAEQLMSSASFQEFANSYMSQLFPKGKFTRYLPTASP
jgi:hypothetical protein